MSPDWSCASLGERETLSSSSRVNALAPLLVLVPLGLAAHGGGLDSLGCHHDRKRGGYHCHRGSLAGQSFKSKSDALKVLNKLKPNKQLSRWRTVVRVIDGDTIVLDGNEKVRLIGVDTPETVHPQKPVERFGKEASAFTRRMIEGKKVRLEFDQTRKDRYGRTLAYVYLEDGTFLNEEIIKQGYGFAYTRFPFRYMERFRDRERRAREAGRGLWGSH